MYESFSEMKFKITKIVGDGNCLFRAVSCYEYKHRRFYFRLRERAVEEIFRKWDVNKYFVDNGYDDIEENYMRKVSYCEEMLKLGTYGATVEISSLASILNIDFHLYHRQEADGISDQKLSIIYTKSCIMYHV